MLRSKLLPTLVTLALAITSPALAGTTSTDGPNGDNMVAALSNGAAGAYRSRSSNPAAFVCW